MKTQRDRRTEIIGQHPKLPTICSRGHHFIDSRLTSGTINGGRSKGLVNVEFLKASAEELPFNNDYFDTIICTNSFHHYFHPDIVLKEIFRVLKPNGKIYILDITSDDYFISWINRKVQKKEKAHVSFYSTSEYKDMFTKSGLRHVKSKRLTYPLKFHIAEK